MGAIKRDITSAGGAEQAPAAASRAVIPTRPAPTTALTPPRRQRKLLFFAANADKHQLLEIGKEYDAILGSIRASRYHENITPVVRLTGRLSDLHQALIDERPDILHFSCHGSARRELWLAHEGGGVAPVPAVALSETLRVLRDNLILVVFNACFSDAQADAIRDCVGLAIGMGHPIEDPAAIAFSAALYRALASGRSVQDAFDLGASAILGNSSSDPGPRLFPGHGIDARRVCLVQDEAATPSAASQRPRRWPWVLLAAGCLGLASAVMTRWVPPSAPPPPGMVRIAASSVRMGVFSDDSRPLECRAPRANEDCAAPRDPKTVAETRVESFDLDRMEVTNGEFAGWLNARLGWWQARGDDGIVTTRGEPGIPLLRTTKCGDGLTIAPDGHAQVTADSARWPVVCVTWHGADEYCRAEGKRLPLDVEWELAAKGAEGRPFPWGSDQPLDDGVAYNLRDGAQVHPRGIGESPRDVTPEGVNDLGGNVAEWVEDGRGNLEQKTLRGGSFASRGPCHLLGSSCARTAADSYHKDLGFRCARSVIDRPRGEKGAR